MRGLKYLSGAGFEHGFESHPTGVRGLKCLRLCTDVSRRLVAPHWGAWIEIARRAHVWNADAVAPHWGAWIEISAILEACPGRGVAPHWGAWIEIRLIIRRA